MDLSMRSASVGCAGNDGGEAGQDDLQDAYLSELLSYSLERLNKEPELLRADAERVRRQMQEVAVSHYRAFITAAGSVQSIRQELKDIDQHLEALIADVPRLTAGCNQFMEDAQQVVEKRRLNRTMLGNHNTLMDIVEIPQLMDTCVRNQNYDEALDLEAFVTKLATMHSKLPVIQALAEEVRHITQAMLNMLLQRLCSNIQLPECLRVVGYLRRLAVFNEQEMRLQFLQCREAWLVDLIAELDQSSAYDYIKRMTDCHRVHLFDVVTQYRAIFADDTSAAEEANDGGLLYSWALHRVTAYLGRLQAVLPRISDGGSLASVLEHCMYCGMSLGRVALDFRGLLPTYFEACILAMFRRNMGHVLDSFAVALESHRWVHLQLLGSGGRGNGTDDPSHDVAPPYSLMEHPPLAGFVNGVLAALNELRHCPPTGLRGTLAEEMNSLLRGVVEHIQRYHDTHMRVLRDSEGALLISLCRAFVEVAAPYTVLCFSKCYPAVAAPPLIDLKAMLEPVRQLVIAAMPPPPLPRPFPSTSSALLDSQLSAASVRGSGGSGGGGGAVNGSCTVERAAANEEGTTSSHDDGAGGPGKAEAEVGAARGAGADGGGVEGSSDTAESKWRGSTAEQRNGNGKESAKVSPEGSPKMRTTSAPPGPQGSRAARV